LCDAADPDCFRTYTMSYLIGDADFVFTPTGAFDGDDPYQSANVINFITASGVPEYKLDHNGTDISGEIIGFTFDYCLPAAAVIDASNLAFTMRSNFLVNPASDNIRLIESVEYETPDFGTAAMTSYGFPAVGLAGPSSFHLFNDLTLFPVDNDGDGIWDADVDVTPELYDGLNVVVYDDTHVDAARLQIQYTVFATDFITDVNSNGIDDACDPF